MQQGKISITRVITKIIKTSKTQYDNKNRLHTAGVTGSSPVLPTRFTDAGFERVQNSMSAISSLTKNVNLLSLACIIEEMTGSKIELEIMGEEHSKVAACSIRIIPETFRFNLIYIPEAPPSDDMICHELMHIILAVEGFPGAQFKQELSPEHLWILDDINFIFNLILHLEVWPLSEHFGFSEASRYDEDIRILMIPSVEKRELFGDGHWYDIQRLYHFCSGLLCPAYDETKEILKQAIKKSYPYLYQEVLDVCGICKAHLPLTPESLLSLGNILSKPLPLPANCISLSPLFERQIPNFRKVVFDCYCNKLNQNEK